MAQRHGRGDSLGTGPSGLKAILLGSTIAGAVASSGCMPLAIAYHGHEVREGLREAAEINSNSGYSRDYLYGDSAPIPTVPKCFTFDSSPFQEFHPAWYGIDEDEGYRCAGTFSIHPEGIQFVSENYPGVGGVILYENITRIEPKEGVLFADDQIIFHFTGQESKRMNLWLKKNNDVTSLAEWIVEQKNPRIVISR